MELLIRHNANVNVFPSDGVTALHMAAYNQFDRGVRLLCRSNANVNAPPLEIREYPLLSHMLNVQHVRYDTCYVTVRR